MKTGRQTTLGNDVAVSGVGVHSGLPVTLTLHPADADSGITFVRTGLEGRSDREIRADFRSVTATDFATVLGDSSGPLCSTAEHVLAALSGLGVDNAVVEIDGPEVPIMDGSAEPFVAAIDQVGIVSLAAPKSYIQILKPVRVAKGESLGELRPYGRGFRLEIDIEFDHPLIGKQSCALDLDPAAFRRELARARTFGFMRDVAKLWSAGYALGATFDNTLVVTENRVLNPDGVRFSDEFVRHKALDALGDLALAGLPLIGAYHSVRGGHKLNHAVLSALMADRSAWTVVEGVRRVRGHAELGSGLAAPTYGPDVS
ncbi:UDP-3-O-acyl-N-acetylglucosamine deacetylase [Xanthobacteraceae bacterium Astr-EGSB]|uniref:UDP-3-O-acyl-N-acetylglucosamine deacetylase n=1 Tax=Astrobacterium formosum TaxID=3069710 RepID=UPI0027B61A58|nr:UDP-3-O-acyl-N-acetylglucosamine deacetylase [Xanthobacteraceae bacterium Astr-EGSB]